MLQDDGLSGRADMLRIFLLGGFRVLLGARIIQEEWNNRRKARSLVKLLALARDHRLLREQIMDQLWPDLELEAAANNLHQTLHHARRLLEPTRPSVFLRLQGEHVSLSPADKLWVDAEAFEAASAAAQRNQDPARYLAALDLYAGDLLPEDRYEDWATTRRESLRRVYHGLLNDLARLHELRGERVLAIKALERLVASDPFAEDVQRELMRLYALSSQRYQAVQRYQHLRELLRSDLDTEPDQATSRMYQEILQRRWAPEEPALSVLPPAASGTLVEVPSAPVPLVMGTEAESITASPAEEHLTNLPYQLTSFIGRQHELQEIKHLLSTTRLLTLVGTGGCGKTRLAQEAARQSLHLYSDGVWLAELAALRDPLLVPQAVAVALSLREEAGHPLDETLANHLRSNHLLLILDNCEHLGEAVSQLARILLAACPQVSILATSRSALGFQNEMIWRVPSLAAPNPEHLPSFEELPAYDAIRLFVERAAHSRPGFRLTPQNALALVQICHRLDGIPLALELAAVRVRVASAEQIADRLDDCFAVLGVGNQTALPRHQTLQATLDWSYDLLSEQEQVVFRRLAAFVGGWTLEAAESICVGGQVQAREMLGVLEQLTDKSVIRVEQHDDQVSYRLLEIIRQYSAEKLLASGEEAAIRHRHLEWYLRLAEEAEPEITGPQQEYWLNRLEREHENLRAALRTSLAAGEVEKGVRLAGALWRFWHGHSHLTEGLRWMEQFLAASQDPSAIDTLARAKMLHAAGWFTYLLGNTPQALTFQQEALQLRRRVNAGGAIADSLNALGMIAHYQGEYAQSLALHEEALALKREVGDRRGTIETLSSLSILAKDQGQYKQAALLMEEGLALARSLKDTHWVSGFLINLGDLAFTQGDYSRASKVSREALELCRRSGDTMGVSFSLQNLGIATLYQGNYQQATATLEEGIALSRKLGDKWNVASGLNALGLCAYYQGDAELAMVRCSEALALQQELHYDPGIAESLALMGRIHQLQGEFSRASILYHESITHAQKAGDQRGLTICLEYLAGLVVFQGQPLQAARLFGAAAAFRQASGMLLPPTERTEHERIVGLARAALGEQDWQAAWAAGQTLSLEDARTEALAGNLPSQLVANNVAAPEAGPRANLLSRREREIVALIAVGRTNRQIAQELGIAERTVDTHVSNILKKLDLPGRAQVAAWAVEQGMVFPSGAV